MTRAATLALAAAAWTSTVLSGQALSSDRIWSGAFTDAQAERGKTAYLNSCTNCHGLKLDGTIRAPSLSGDRFVKTWHNGSVGRLFRKIRDSMPATYADTVPEAIKVDIVAYLLRENGFPAGSSELKLDVDEMENIQIAKKGSNEVPNFALASVVGCLAENSDHIWTLRQTAPPSLVREEVGNAGALQNAQTRPLGSETYILVSVGAFKPEQHAGHKMEARGLLYREPGENRINLTSLQMVSSDCTH